MSYKKQSIKITDLLINIENSRFDPVKNQEQALSIMIEKIKSKIKNLAEDISQNGLNPGKLWYVVKNDSKFLVLEGNRRLTAIKLVSNPDLIDLDKETKSFFQGLKDNFGKSLPKDIDCIVFDSEEDAYRWIQLEHTGENNGIGLVKWDSEQTDRFKAQASGSKLTKGVQVLDFMRKNELYVQNINVTNIDRLMGTPYVREQIGIGFEKGSLILDDDKKNIVDDLNKVVDAMSRSNFNVGKIYTADLRKKWIDDVLSNENSSTKHKEEKKIDNNGSNRKDEDVGGSLAKIDWVTNDEYELYKGADRVKDILKELNRNKPNKDVNINILAVTLRVVIELAIYDKLRDKGHIKKIVSDQKTAYEADGKELSPNWSPGLKAMLKFMLNEANNIVTDPQDRKAIGKIMSERKDFIEHLDFYIHNVTYSPTETKIREIWQTFCRPIFDIISKIK